MSWSAGVLEYWKKAEPEFQFELVFSLLHYSTTPRDLQIKKRPVDARQSHS
jgi:hypothetical protein